MIYARQLTKNDLPQLHELVNLRPKVFNSIEEQPSELENHYNEWIESDKCFSVGAFEDNKLIIAINAIESEHTPSWLWSHCCSDKNLWLSPAKGVEGLKYVDTILFDEMESNRNLNRFFVIYRKTIPESRVPKGTGLHSTGLSSRLFALMNQFNFRVSRYKFLTDCIIPANTLAKYPYQQTIQGHKTYPIDTEIRMGVLIDNQLL
jgi:hypothetical protein